MKLEDCYAKLDEEGNIIFFDNITNEESGRILSPYMYDSSNGENSYNDTNLRYELINTNEEGVYKLKLTVDREYLSDKERVYPITIDPTYKSTAATATDHIKASFVSSANPTTNYYESDVMWVGYGDTYKRSRTIVRFPEFNNVVGVKQGVTINSATLKLVQKACDNPYQATVTVRRNTQDCSLNTVTWNTRPNWRTGDENIYDSKQPASSTASITLNLKRIMQEWANGTYENFGIALVGKGEYANKTSKNNTRFYKSRTATASNRPVLTVSFSVDVPTTASEVVINGGKPIQSGQTSIHVAAKGITT